MIVSTKFKPNLLVSCNAIAARHLDSDAPVRALFEGPWPVQAHLPVRKHDQQIPGWLRDNLSRAGQLKVDPIWRRMRREPKVELQASPALMEHHIGSWE